MLSTNIDEFLSIIAFAPEIDVGRDLVLIPHAGCFCLDLRLRRGVFGSCSRGLIDLGGVTDGAVPLAFVLPDRTRALVDF